MLESPSVSFTVSFAFALSPFFSALAIFLPSLLFFSASFSFLVAPAARRGTARVVAGRGLASGGSAAAGARRAGGIPAGCLNRAPPLAVAAGPYPAAAHGCARRARLPRCRARRRPQRGRGGRLRTQTKRAWGVLRALAADLAGRSRSRSGRSRSTTPAPRRFACRYRSIRPSSSTSRSSATTVTPPTPVARSSAARPGLTGGPRSVRHSPAVSESALGGPDRPGVSGSPGFARMMPLGVPRVVEIAGRPRERKGRKYVSHLTHSLMVVADDKTVGPMVRDSTGRSPSFSNLARGPATRSLSSCFSDGLESWAESVA